MAGSLYKGKRVKVRIGGKIKAGKVIDIGDGEFCIEYDSNGQTEWVSNKTLVT